MRSIEVVEMVRHHVAVFLSQEPKGERVQVRHQNEAVSARLEQLCCFGHEMLWEIQMLQHGPKADGIERGNAGLPIQQGLSIDADASAFGVVQRLSRHVRAEQFVPPWKPRP